MGALGVLGATGVDHRRHRDRGRPGRCRRGGRARAPVAGCVVGSVQQHCIKDIWVRTETPAAIWFDAASTAPPTSLACSGTPPARTSAGPRRSGSWPSRSRRLTCSTRAPSSPPTQPATWPMTRSTWPAAPTTQPASSAPGRCARPDSHTIPYVRPDGGGPPGQTALHNLGLMTRRSHRIKTHSRWQVRQVFNGVFVWRSPSGRLYLVNNTGTHPIPHTAA